MRGRVLALQAMVFLGSTPIGGPLVGWVAEHLGARYAVGLGAVACVAAGAWGVTVARRDGVDDAPPAPDVRPVSSMSRRRRARPLLGATPGR